MMLPETGNLFTAPIGSSPPSLPPRPPLPAPNSSKRAQSPKVGTTPQRFAPKGVSSPPPAFTPKRGKSTCQPFASPTEKESTLQRANSTSSLRGSAALRTPTPNSKRDASGASEPACVRGVGAGGVVELSQHLCDGTVAWALLRFQVGGGTFSRTKLVAIHFNGEETPVMLRGWLNARSSEFSALMGEVHANIEVTRTSDLTVDYLCERLLPLFAADNMNYSLRSLHQEYGRMIAQMEEEAARKRQAAAAAAVAAPASSQERAPETLEKALSAVGADHGSCNWVLLEARTLKLHSAGYGGLEELKAKLLHDKVLFGILRLTFGCSSRTVNAAKSVPGITKHIFVHWVGPRVGAVQRGLLNARLSGALSTVAKRCAVVFRREAHGLEDLEIEDLVAELRRLTEVDGVAAADGVATCRISTAEYLAALREEVNEREHVEVKEVETPTPSKTIKPETQLPDFRTAVESVRSPSGDWNWVLYGCEQRPREADAIPEMPRFPKSPARGGA